MASWEPVFEAEYMGNYLPLNDEDDVLGAPPCGVIAEK
jgi:hypothetical protein